VTPTFTPQQIKNDRLLERRQDKSLREQRVWRLIYVQLGTWLFFAIFLLAQGFPWTSFVSCFEVILMAALVSLKNNASERSYAFIMHSSLAASGVGIFLVAISDTTLHPTMFYYPASILIASQLLGVRAAFFWCMINILAHSLFFCTVYGISNVWVDKSSELISTCGTAVCLFFCCQQGEAFYKERTLILKQISQKLAKKGRYLHGLATTDSLTGLFNRFQFQTELEIATANALSTGQQMALFVIDMDGFKEVNDTLGHPIGDKALIEISNRLKAKFPPPAIVSRLGGDEFCVIIPNVGGKDTAKNIGLAARDWLGERYVFEQCDFPLESSIGVALCPDDSQDATDLLAFADTAMFQAKENRLGCALYTPRMTDDLVEYRSTQEKLSLALARGEFFLTYQPQVSIATGEIFGAEALLRWRHQGEVISPARFIPLLEKSREIIDVGQWVIRESCRQMRHWQEREIDIKLSINVSPIQFLDREFSSVIEQALTEFNVNASSLDFEITESLLIEDVSLAMEKLTQIKKLGATISIDDFGTGYSSLAYLRQFPLDRLKIDRAFIKDIPDSDDGLIAASIVALGKAIGLQVLAEGVETPEQLDFLKLLACDEYQGYLSSAPMTAEEFDLFYAKIPKRPDPSFNKKPAPVAAPLQITLNETTLPERLS
jgi:diguanylate cyclase (GGDEF)-like protein